MIGVYDFCGHYEWTFAWLESRCGKDLVEEYWDGSIHQDSQRHAAETIGERGIEGMNAYWGHTLDQEGAGYSTTVKEDSFRIDMHSCPSKGFLLNNNLEQYGDYCNHCIGWIGPMMDKAGFETRHEHNHCGQCWWEFRRSTEIENTETTEGEAGEGTGNELVEGDVRADDNWNVASGRIDKFHRR